MPFTTLAERFEQSSKDIYGRLSAQTPQSNQPYISIKPDSQESRSRIKDDIRLFPIGVSVSRDATRISRFLRSNDGVLFIAKQTLLQTGNTFADTKLYNPASPLLNTVPGVHAKRHISTSLLVNRYTGLLQASTLSKFSKAVVPQVSSPINSTRNIIPTLRELARGEVRRRIAGNTLVQTFTGQEYNSSRPEFVVFGAPLVFNPRLNTPAQLSSRASATPSSTISINSLTQKAAKVLKNSAKNIIKSLLKNPTTSNFRSAVNLEVVGITNTLNAPPTSFVEAAINFKNKQTDKRLNGRYFSGNQFTDWSNNPESVVSFPNNIPVIGQGSTSNIKDPYNKSNPRNKKSTSADNINYDSISGDRKKNSDIIKFIFTSTEGTPVHFRAFISAIKESVKPEFNEQRYIGRTERFVTYGGVRRSVSMTFNIVAFSKSELDNMWSRINYLTGLAFPKGVSESGFMIPPLFKLTVGGIYDLQPCYIDSLDYDLLDDSITFDIDSEVSQVINVNMSVILLEKRSRFYNSPFYSITEDIAQSQNFNSNRTRLTSTAPTGASFTSTVSANARAELDRKLSNLRNGINIPKPKPLPTIQNLISSTTDTISNSDVQRICGENADCIADLLGGR
jgi:hypothetical protein